MKFAKKLRNVDPNWARAVVGKAIRTGEIIPPMKCEQCGKTKKTSGHHDDYNKPLVVRWLCASCHRKFHLGREGTAMCKNPYSIRLSEDLLERIGELALEMSVSNSVVFRLALLEGCSVLEKRLPLFRTCHNLGMSVTV